MNEIGLGAAIAEWLEEHVEKRHGLQTEFIDARSDGRQPDLDDDSRALLFRNTRELLTNVIKHAQAQKVRVKIAEKIDTLQISIEDDGKGFDVRAIEKDDTKRNHFGLFSVQERMIDLGGSLEIESEPGKGSRLIMAAPKNTGGHSLGV